MSFVVLNMNGQYDVVDADKTVAAVEYGIHRYLPGAFVECIVAVGQKAYWRLVAAKNAHLRLCL